MRRWTLLFVCLAGVLAAAGPQGQTIGARALTIVPDSANATADWGTIVDRMVRGNELHVRLERSDTIMTGRSVEQLTQCRGLQVWGQRRAAIRRHKPGLRVRHDLPGARHRCRADGQPRRGRRDNREPGRDAAAARHRTGAGESCRTAVHSGWPGSGKQQRAAILFASSSTQRPVRLSVATACASGRRPTPRSVMGPAFSATTRK